MPLLSKETGEITRPEALQVLLDASAMLLATSSEQALLTGILNLASRLFDADAYAVWRCYEGGTVWKAVATRGLSESYRTEITVQATQTPRTILAVEDLLSDPNVSRFKAVYDAEGIRSMLVVPLVLQGVAAGTITFYWKQARRFSESDKDYASALSNLSAAALTISELHEQAVREKRRLAFLAEASSVLASSLDYETTLQQVARLAVPHIADWCIVHVVEDGVPNRLIVAHADPAMLTSAQEFSRKYPEELVPERGLGLLLRTGKSEFFPRITDEMLVPAARDAEHLRMLRQLAMTSSILVPLTSRGTILGAIRLLAAGSGRHFTTDDLQLAEDLGRRAAAAIENAQLHRAVVEQEGQLRLSHAAAKIGHWTLDLARNKAVWSNEFKAIHHLPPETEPTVEGGAALIHPEDRESVLKRLQETLESGADVLSMDHRTLTPDGRLLWMQSRGRVLRDETGKAVRIHGVTIDVTESRLAENALRRTEKLAAAGRLAATVAHEVNNPLESLMNLIYLAESTEGLPPQAILYLKTASEEIKRMAHVVRQTLGFYRESIHPVETDLGPAVAEVFELYRGRAHGRSLRLSFHAEPGLMVRVNSGEIRQVIANLVSNAIDATPAGGVIAADVRRIDGHVRVQVTDTGTGIAPGDLEHLFEPFFTTKSDVGTGLGLWVSKGIVDKHGGSLVLESRQPPERGTIATILLPAL